MAINIRTLVLLPLSAGILGGALGFAGTAAADVTVNTTTGNSSIVATPDTKAHPLTLGRKNWHLGADSRAQMGR